MPHDTPLLTLTINGQPYTGWKNIEVGRSIERMGGEFYISLTDFDKTPFVSSDFLPFMTCVVEIDGQIILDGYIDAVSHNFQSITSQFEIRGRDKTGDLVDCAASIDGPFEFINQDLSFITKKILLPFNIPLNVETSIGAAFSRFAIQPGETAYEVIERVCRYRSVLPLSNGVGGLVITKPGSSKANGRLVYGENILSGSTSIDQKDRFSLYVVKGQTEGFDQATAEEISSPEGRSSDTSVPRFRPKLITAEAQGYDLTLQERANWEKQFAKARALRANYTVQGWFEDGKSSLWKPNTLVRVVDPKRSLNRELLIIGVNFSRSSRGTVTNLELAIPEAFNLPAEKEAETEDLWGGL